MIGYSRAFSTLVVVVLLGCPAFSQGSPRAVLERFSELDARGGQFSPDGQREIAKLFASMTEVKRKKIIVVRDFVVSHPALKKDQAEFYVEYIQLGRINTLHATFSSSPTLKVRADFELALTSQHSESESNRGVTQEQRPSRWQIQGSPPEPHLTVDAAIHYLTELRDKSAIEVIKKNAEKSISALRHLR
jgi:hypothetical protein